MPASKDTYLAHYVIRIGNRQKSYDFYTKTLKMKVLRHEEFDEGCEATCNGPYDSKWSKTMIGHGDEKKHFVMELTYNYGEDHYDLGNDFNSIHIESDEIYENVKDEAKSDVDNTREVRDPDGHLFVIHPGKTETPMKRVVTNVKNLAESKKFWAEDVGMPLVSETKDSVILSYGKNQAALELKQLPDGEELKRGTAYGRIAFAYPTEDLKAHQEHIKKINPRHIQNEFMSLDTPGKATVNVVICRDDNDHEICFVGAKEFFELAQIDPKGDELIRDAISKDDSHKWKNN